MKRILLSALLLTISSISAHAADLNITNENFNSKINTDTAAQGGVFSIIGNDANGVVTGSIFTNNAANGSMYSLGGAIYSTANSLSVSDSIFDNNKSFDAPDGNYGGAVFADGSAMRPAENSTITFDNTKFINNSAGGSTFRNAGGAIATQMIKNLDINNSYFENNSVIGNVSDVKYYAIGGAISTSYVVSPIGPVYTTPTTLTINNSVFKNNYVINPGKVYGGAIGSIAVMDTIIKNSEFIGNHVSDSYDARGGAIYSQLSTMLIENTDFENNYIENSQSIAIGGAIAAIGTELTIKNSNFLNNYVTSSKTAQGGAIYLQGNGAAQPAVLNLIADGQNIEFSGNTANGSSSGIHAASNSKINFNIASGNKIIMNDKILSSASNTIVLNINNSANGNPSEGMFVANASMNSYGGIVNLYGGTLKLGENGTSFRNAQSFISYDGAVIDLQNNKLNTFYAKNLILNGTTDVKIDADLFNERIDSFDVTNASGNGNLKITDINVLSDINPIKDSISANFITGTGASNITTTMNNSLNTIFTQDSKYDVSLNGNTLTFDKSDYDGGLAGAVAADNERQYQMGEDEIVTDWGAPDKNQLNGSTLVVKGNQNAVIGSHNEGIIINNTQGLIINGVGTADSEGNIQKSWSDFSSTLGGAINNDGKTTIKDSIFTNNSASNKGGAIYNTGVVNIIAQENNVIFANNTANSESNAIHNNSGTLNFNANIDKAIIFNDKITSEDNTGVININASNNEQPTIEKNIPGSGTVVLNNDMSGYTGDVNLYHGTIKVGADGTFFNPNNFNIYGCTLDFANNVVQNYNLGNLYVADSVDVMVDADLSRGVMDTLSADSYSGAGSIDVNYINLLSDASQDYTKIHFVDENLKDAVTYSGKDTAYSPIYKYNIAYDKENGEFNFMRFGGPGSEKYNPGILAGAVAAQLGSYLTQLNSYDMAFNNVDMYMLMSKETRQSLKARNKIAYTGQNLTYSPLTTKYDQKGMWYKPYTTFENVPLKNGPRVSNVSYGSYFGGDSELIELGKGFDGMFSLYAGYNGSHQAYNGVGIYQNGGLLGATGVVYKGNFFSALTANVGANAGEASTMFGNENFTMLTAGVASKTGYNWELAEGRFIIQPNYQMSYTFVNTFDYRNAAGVNINSDPLNAIQIAPGVRFIGNLKNGWQPYIGVQMVWNVIDDTRFKANDVSLPDLSVKPYIAYGVGVQKRWGERFTGFLQTMFYNGGRNGIGIQFGFRFALGK